MTRFLLLLPLVLLACQKKDPEGALVQDQDGRIENIALAQGDSQPLRLRAGSFRISMTADMPKAGSDALAACDPKLRLVKYGAESGREVPITSGYYAESRIEGVPAGLYTLRTTYAQNTCKFKAHISQQ